MLDPLEEFAKQVDADVKQFVQDLEKKYKAQFDEVHMLHLGVVLVPVTKEFVPCDTVPVMVVDTVGNGGGHQAMYMASVMAHSAENRLNGGQDVQH